MSGFDPLYKVHPALESRAISKRVYDLITERFPLVKEGIARVEAASGLKYPYYYVEPSLVVSTSATEYTHMGIFFARTTDRLGKGIRTGARDAILSDEATPETKGKVFGFHRSMDTMGAVLGPAFALLYLYFFPFGPPN